MKIEAVLMVVGFVVAFVLGMITPCCIEEQPVVEVGPVEQCPPCPDAGVRAISLDPWALEVTERAIKALRRCDADRDQWREQAEQCAAEKLEIKR